MYEIQWSYHDTWIANSTNVKHKPYKLENSLVLNPSWIAWAQSPVSCKFPLDPEAVLYSAQTSLNPNLK